MAEKEAAEHQENVTRAVEAATGRRRLQRAPAAPAQVMAMQQVPTLAADVDPSELVRDTLERAETSHEIAETMGERAGRYQEVHETRERWVAETQQVRDEAAYAQAELDRRAPAAPEPEDQPAPPAEPTWHERQAAVMVELDQAMEQARRAEEILQQRAQERELAEQEKAAQQPAVEEIDRERRDTGLDYSTDYARVGREIADAELGLEPVAYEPPAPAPEPPAPPMPDLDIDL